MSETTALSKRDADLAWRFAESCYDRTMTAPTRTGMLRLVELGLVTEVRPGQFAETPALRAHGY